MSKRLLLLATVLLLTAGARVWLSAAPLVPHHRPLSEFPRQLGDYKMVSSSSIDPDVQAVLKSDDYILRSYATGDGRRADLFVAYYASQQAGESMHSPKNCLPGSGWNPVVNDRIDVNGPNGRVKVNRYVVEKDGQKSLILYWYHSGNRIYASEYWGKAYLVADAARTGRRDGAIARVVVPLGKQATSDEATEALLSLVPLIMAETQREF